jgi:signal transduction histidine kinase
MEFNNSVDGTIFHFNHNLADESNIDKNIEVTLYRILQEALNNVIKYANANEVNVQLRDYNDILMLTVEDDGSGFDVEEAKSSDIGFGLRSMQNRIDAISGVLEIESAPGKGTFIVVQISKDILTEV